MFKLERVSVSQAIRLPRESRQAIALLGGRLEQLVTFSIGGAEHAVAVIRKVRPTPPAYPRRFGKIKQQPL